MAGIKRANTSGITKTGTAISDVPDAPTIGAVTDSGDGTTATVAYTAAVTGGTVTTFTATSTPGSFTGTGSSPISVTGLTAGTAYTFKVKGTNATATGPESAASSAITPATPTSYESIATTTLASANSTITFNSIPSTYKHLQIRFMGRDSRTGTALEGYLIRFNGDTAANYQDHMIYGDGSSAAYSYNLGAGATAMAPYGVASAGASANVFGASIVDILDYTNTNKYKTIRALTGSDNNGTGTNPGAIAFTSGAWRNTAAITSIDIVANVGSFQQYTSAALYGIKG